MPQSKTAKKIISSVTTFYTGKRVPRRFQMKYGKRYSKSEAKSVGYAIARKMGLKV